MKLKCKILTAFLVIISLCVIFCLNEVQAVGNVSHAWKVVDEQTGDAILLYRSFVTPYSTTLQTYTYTNSQYLVTDVNQDGSIKKQWTYKTYSGSIANSKWVYGDTPTLPSTGQYNTLSIVFHREPYSDYPSLASGEWGYLEYGGELNYEIASISDAVSSSRQVRTEPSYSGSSDILKIKRYDGEIVSVPWGTGIGIKNVFYSNPVQYRYALVYTGGKNIYVADNVVYSEDLKTLVNGLGNETSCYVSSEWFSKTWANSQGADYEVSQYASDFIKQHGKNWSQESKGITNGALGSALNMYDNIINFPAFSTRKIYIKHINIGTGNTIDKTVIDNAKAAGKYIIPLDEEKYIEVADQKVVPTKEEEGYQEYYEEIPIDKNIRKLALNTTLQSNDYKELKLDCLGYNIGIAADKESAQAYVDSLSTQGKYNSEKTVHIDGKDTTSNDDVIVIEFYYSSEQEKKVYVNHVNVGTSSTISTSIIQNSTAVIPLDEEKYITVGGTKVSTTQTDSPYEEYYEKVVMKDNISKLALSATLQSGTYKELELKCLGYNVGIGTNKESAQASVNSSSALGKYTSSLKASIDKEDVTSEDEAIVIEFYYSSTAETEIPEEVPEPTFVAEPAKIINGNVFTIAALQKYRGECDDTQSYTINSVPSGENATVGVEGIPEYMAGGITIQKEKIEHELTVNFKISVGPHEYNVPSYLLKYSSEYYYVTNMLVYRFMEDTIYNSGKGYSGTLGDSIFSWSYNVDNSLSKATTLKLTGVLNKSISSSNLEDESKYVNVLLSTDFGNYDVTKLSTKSIAYSYLSRDAWYDVDINGDGEITDDGTDLDLAEQLEEQARQEKEAAESAEEEAEAAESAAKGILDAAKSALDAAKSASEDATSASEDATSALASCNDKNANCSSGCKDNEEPSTCESACKVDCSSYETAAQEAATKASAAASALSAAQGVYNSAYGEWEKADAAHTSAERRLSTAKTNYTNAINVRKHVEAYDGPYEALHEEYKRVIAMNKWNIANEFDILAEIKVRNMKLDVKDLKGAYHSLYSQTDTKSKNVSFASKTELDEKHELKTEKPVVSTSKYNNLTRYITQSDYTNSNTIPSTRLNGIRALAGLVKYKTEIALGGGSEVVDNAYYSSNTYDSNNDTLFKVAKNKEITKSYKVNAGASSSTTKYKEVKPVNVYTPITVTSSVYVPEDQIVNQTDTDFNVPLIQLNTPFTITIGNNQSESVYSLSSTTKYNMGYYIKFDFDVHRVKIGSQSYKNGEKIPAGTWIGFLPGNNVQVTAQAYGNIEGNELSIVTEEQTSYTIRAVAYNATSIMRNNSKLYPTIDDLFAGMYSTVENICTNPSDLPSYFSEATNDVVIINRMYGFRVTDVKDLEWKSTFRNTSGSSVNKHTGNSYYTGITKWDTSSTSKVNKIVSRTTSEIGRSPLRILPLGPYKNSDITKISAPKLGYRFSYDFKVTGSYFNSSGQIKENKEVIIQTKFYYISKDGKTFIEESSGGAGIYLFYKNSDGKYVRIDGNGGNYQLTYTPYDGYRYISDSTTGTLSEKAVSLGNLRTMKLTYQMATPSDNRAAITYYGEYKLPNSTIAVKVDSNGKYDINKPLTNGYIGVIFDIATYSGRVRDNGTYKDVVLRYAQNTKSQYNTSQWDYEGFLGFTNYGNKVKDGEVSLKLEKGTWQINNTIYNKIKGTVILYDMDKRAASDFD